MSSPNDQCYSDTHEWHKLDGDTVTIGISRFAVDELTDITYVEFRKNEGDIADGEAFGEIESVKATSELYCGIDGRIIEVNQQAIDDPSIVTRDPWNEGWLIKVKPADAQQLDQLKDAPAYDAATVSG
jgi:glycine cleavage system H protein